MEEFPETAPEVEKLVESGEFSKRLGFYQHGLGIFLNLRKSTREVELVETPKGVGEDSDTDVILFTCDSRVLAGSFGLQVRRLDGSLKSICDLDGETLSSSATWIVPNQVPVQIAEHAESICS